MPGPGPRLNFDDFLDRLAVGRVSVEEWRACAVAHDGDAVLVRAAGDRRRDLGRVVDVRT